MRAAILSDIHANREALEAVEARLETLRIDRVLFLGDAVGYNADPDYCLRRVSALVGRTGAAVRGNHDKTITDPGNLSWFNEVARAALVWTRRALSPEAVRLAGELPAGPVLAEGRWLICHGAPTDEDQYVTRAQEAAAGFRFLAERFPEVRLVFCGHTHVPLLLEERGRAIRPPQRFVLKQGRRYLINPGSVGQPRDRVPQASFGVLDEEGMVYEHYRVPYPIEKTQAKVLAAGLDPALAERLAGGW
jgi:predicted phosphodiesterase